MKRLLLVIIGAAALAWAGAVPEDAARRQFLAWFQTYDGPIAPPEVMKAYSAKLTAGGMPAAEIKDHLDIIGKYAVTQPPDLLAIHFDNIYRAHQDLFSQEPNGFLVRSVRGLKAGAALDVAMGQGRNSVFLAMQGWDVTGYDIAEKGMAAANAAAEKAKVSIRTVRSTHQDFDYGKERWDLIVMTYAFVNMDDPAFLKRVRDSLKPGGLLVIEQMNGPGTGKGPANALFRSFQDLRVIHYEDVVDTAEWSKAPMRIGRLVAQRD